MYSQSLSGVGSAENSLRGSEPNAPRAIAIQVDELVLDGFPSGDRHRIGEAFQRELARLMSERGALSGLDRGKTVEQLSGGSFQFNAEARPERTGIDIARAVFGGLRQ